MHRLTAVTLIALVVLASLLVALGVGPATGQQSSGDGRIVDVAYAGEAVTPSDNETVVWRTSEHAFDVTIESSDGLEDASVCVVWDDAPDDEPLSCTSTSVPAGTTHEATVSIADWPANRTGVQDLRFTLAANASGAVVDEAVVSVTALSEEGDLDGDGLANGQEVSLGADLRAVDTDGDGLEDGPEVHAHETSPTNTDTDNDGLADGPEVHTHETNATNADTDDDGLNDGAEVEEDTNPTDPDTDDDGLTDNLEVATYGTDPTAVDSDDDGLEDGPEVHEHRTDPADADTDGDGLEDGAEVNEFGTDPTATDTDGDGLEDGAEVNRFETDPTTADTDGDGVPDPQEVERAGLLSPALLVGLVVLALLGSAGLLYWIVRRRRDGWLSNGRNGRPSVGTEADHTPHGAGPTETMAGEVPREALPNRERVMALLDEHGGRMQQSDVVEETDWSKSKVSRVLAEMEADGDIAKISLGRENLVTRPDDRPPGSRSTFDE